MARACLKVTAGAHRFLGYFRREIGGTVCYVYRCICGHTEATPAKGGPSFAIDGRFRPRPDARNIAAHAHLERAHQVN
jgi:hypothetical protein